MSITASVYEHANFNGKSRTYNAYGFRYTKAYSAQLSNIGLHDKISSAKLFPDTSHDSLIICFQNRFEGKYLLIGNKKGSGLVQAANNFTQYNMNDCTSSILFVKTKQENKNEIRLNIRDLIQPVFVQMLDGKLSGTQVSRVGNPIITWDMWPVGQDYLSSGKKYLKIQQKLHISIDWWPDYDAIMTYHIYLYIQNHKLKGYAARWWLTVEEGFKSGEIWDALAPKVEAGLNDVNSTIQSALSAFSGSNFSDLYYLPGNQTGGEANGVKTGLTVDDVTLILES